MSKFTKEELKNLLILISRPETVVKANEVMGVAMLQQKISGMLEAEEVVADEVNPVDKEGKTKANQ